MTTDRDDATLGVDRSSTPVVEQVRERLRIAPCVVYGYRHHAVVVQFSEHAPCIVAALADLLCPPESDDSRTPREG